MYLYLECLPLVFKDTVNLYMKHIQFLNNRLRIMHSNVGSTYFIKVKNNIKQGT